MAGSGGGAAYAQLKKPDGGLSQSLQFWGGLQNQSNERALERQADKERQENQFKFQREQADREERLAWEKKYGNIDDLKQTLTGFKTYDQIGRDYTNKIIDNYTKTFQEANEAKRNGDFRKSQELSFKLQSYKNSFSGVNDISAAVNDNAKIYDKLVSEGRSSGLNKGSFEPQYFNMLKGENFDVVPDDKGNPTVRGITSDGRPYDIPYSSFKNRSWRPIEKQDVPALINGFEKTIGQMEVIDGTGKYITEAKVWSDEKQGKAVDSLMDSLLINPDVMGDLLHQFTKGESMKTNNFTQEEYNEVKKQMKDLVKRAYDEKVKTTFNKDLASDERDRQRLAETGRHNRATEANQREANQIKRNAQNKPSDRPDISISEPFIIDVPFGKTTKPIEFKTYTRTGKDGGLQPFSIGGSDLFGNKKEVPSISVSKDIITYEYNGQIQRVDKNKDPKLFTSLINQTEGRDVNTAPKEKLIW